MPVPDATKVASLTDAQRAYLRLVGNGMTSKQIAQAIGGSHHTVNVEVGIAMRILGAASRREAASMLADGSPAGSYEPSYDAPDMASAAVPTAMPPHRTLPGGDDRWTLPIPTAARPINVMGAGRRIGWVLVIAAAVALLLGGVVTGIIAMLTSLDRLI